MIFQDPFASLNPVHTVRYTLTRSLQDPPRSPARRRARDGARRAARAGAACAPPSGTSTSSRTSCPAASASASPSPAPSPPTPRCCSPTSRSRCSTCRSASASSTCCATCATGCSIAILYITHDIASARYFADRTMVMYAGRVVESGDSESVTQDPKHPYTQLLVRSAPDPDDLDARARGARGEAPSLVDPARRVPVQPALPVRHRRVPHRGAAAASTSATAARPPAGATPTARPPELGSVLDAYGERARTSTSRTAVDPMRFMSAAASSSTRSPRGRPITINFFIPRMMPGDPVERADRRHQGRISSDAARVAATRCSGSTRTQSLWQQYVDYWQACSARRPRHARSRSSRRRCARSSAQALPWTIGLVGVATHHQLHARHRWSASASAGAAGPGPTRCCRSRRSSRRCRTSGSA